MSRELHVRISKDAIDREARRAGVICRIRKKKLRLTERHWAARVAFVQVERPHDFWRKVFTTDEKTFTIHYDKRGVWIDAGDDVPPRTSTKYQVNLKVWGGVGYHGLTPLLRVPTSQTGEQYRDFLRDKVGPIMKRRYGSNWIFQQESDGSHTARVVSEWLNSQDIEWIRDWPTLSPDLPGIENLWAILIQRLAERQHRTIEGLWRSLQDEWENISESLCRRLALSVPKRLKKVIELGGEALKH